MAADLTTTEQAIVELLHDVAEAMEHTAPPQDGLSAEEIERYLGDVVETTFGGRDADRVALIARLLTLARTANAAREERDLRAYAWLRRLERPLRRWERGRHAGTASPRPRPAEVDARVAMFSAAQGPGAVIGNDTVAVAVAELVAVHQLAGTTSVEEGIASRALVEPQLRAAAELLETGAPAIGNGVFERPGATLAHVEQATWQIEQITRHAQGPEELPWLRALWLEVAASLVFAHDAYEHRASHDERWRSIQDLAAEKITVGELTSDASSFDEAGTLTLVRSVSLALAALWLDEALHADELQRVPMLDDRLASAVAQSLIAAWVAERRLDAGERAS
ncbi:MAG TPA: hypothetical protein VGM91_05500 [Conexibacter sp.]